MAWLKKIQESILPSEWVILCFLVYSFTRVCWAPTFIFSSSWMSFPSSEILCTFLFVAALRVAIGYKETFPGKRIGLFIVPAIFFLASLSLFSLNIAPGNLEIPGPNERLLLWLSKFRFPLITITCGAILTLAWRMLRVQSPGRRVGALIGQASGLLLAQLRECAPLICAICLYPLVPIIIRSVGAADRDSLMISIDRVLFFGNSPSRLMESLISVPVSEWMAFAYTAYGFFFLIVLSLAYLNKDRRCFETISFAVCLALVLGYTGYTLLPVKGPMFTQKFDTDLSFYYMKEIKAALIDHMRIQRDCFPSLHTAVTLILSWSCWKYWRAFFWVSLPVAASIPVACVYLRYHYVTDVIAGVFLAVGAVALTSLIYKRERSPIGFSIF